ncbi:hypothetical protein DFS33DRAFT_698121 [Desarmillaria ectypa]|nr:hypothetical protein DFS33DRAFT_698121 [Desarmillaria ectypa]
MHAGSLASPFLADRFDRKNTIILSVIGPTLQCASALDLSSLSTVHLFDTVRQNRGMFVVGRAVSGTSVRIASAVVPIYQPEITEPRIRGRLVSLQMVQYLR